MSKVIAVTGISSNRHSAIYRTYEHIFGRFEVRNAVTWKQEPDAYSAQLEFANDVKKQPGDRIALDIQLDPERPDNYGHFYRTLRRRFNLLTKPGEYLLVQSRRGPNAKRGICHTNMIYLGINADHPSQASNLRELYETDPRELLVILSRLCATAFNRRKHGQGQIIHNPLPHIFTSRLQDLEPELYDRILSELKQFMKKENRDLWKETHNGINSLMPNRGFFLTRIYPWISPLMQIFSTTLRSKIGEATA